MPGIITKLHGAFGLVDLLAAGTGGAHEALLDFRVVQNNIGRDVDHGTF